MHLLEKTTAHLQPSCKPRTSPFYAHNTLSCTHQLHTPLDVNNTIVCFISSFGNLFAFPWRLEHVCVDLADNTKLAVSPGNALKIFAVTLNISMGIVLMGTISAHSKAFADWLTSAGTQSKGVFCRFVSHFSTLPQSSFSFTSSLCVDGTWSTVSITSENVQLSGVFCKNDRHALIRSNVALKYCCKSAKRVNASLDRWRV